MFGHRDTHMVKLSVKVKQRFRECFYKAKECHRWSADSRERQGPDSPSQSPGGSPLWTPWLRTLSSRTVRRYIDFCYVSHPVCGTWLQQPWQTNTASHLDYLLTSLAQRLKKKTKQTATTTKNQDHPAMQKTWVQSLDWEDPLKGNGNPVQYSCLGNPVDRGAWQAIVRGVTKSQTGLSD